VNEFLEYVAGSDENEAKMRFEAGLGKQTREEAEADAQRRARGDMCEPKCQFQVYQVRTTLEKLD
jgi:hypothetical protein